MKRVVVAIPHSHTFLWSASCLTALRKFPPRLEGYEVLVVLVDNSWAWSDSILGVAATCLSQGVTILKNEGDLRMHGTALDLALEKFDCDYFMTLETDVLVQHPYWLSWFMSYLRDGDYAVGALREDGEKWLSVSCALYRTELLLSLEKPFNERPEMGWWEPGKWVCRQLREYGWTEAICPTRLQERCNNVPQGTVYGEPALATHYWGGSRASEPLRLPLDGDRFVSDNAAWLLRREAEMWLKTVDPAVQEQIIGLIRKHGWVKEGDPDVARRREYAKFMESCYREAGIPL